ncbi:hypothetical protein [Nocardioides cynanchi]|uniref:hypothetical protein n=1 Tax=Nocardioides cynanchi TaxID=2558918 RepID=UPI001246D42F|nr:hypothetical protein [Nocardioides cynanchi]
MSTQIEDRLTAALTARADLVQPEDLRHLTLPAPQSPPAWRRPAVLALVAAAAAAAIAVPVLLKGDHRTDRPLPPSTGIPTPVQSLSGDVDGDGRPDRLRTSGQTLTVTLAADPSHPITTSVPHLAGLIGFADTGGPAHGILVATSGTTFKNGRDWEAYAVERDKLHVVVLNGSAPNGTGTQSFGTMLGVVPGIAVSWIAPGGVPMSGLLDASQQGERRLAVAVSRFVPGGGGLAQQRVGRWCWDTATQPLPAPCPTGVTDAYDPGPHGSLPSLQRTASPDYIVPGDTWKAARVSLRLRKGSPHTVSPFDQVFDVAGTIDGRHVSAPAGYAMPALYQTFLDLGHGVRGLAVKDDSKGTWNLLAVTSHGLVPLVAQDPSNGKNGSVYLHPGTVGVIVTGKPRAAETWIGPDQQVFTRVATDQVGRFHTYEWQVTDASGTKLVAVDLGTVCIDDFQGTYGTCAG